MRLIAIITFISVLFMIPFLAQAKMLNAVVAIVNDEIITLHDLNRESEAAINVAGQGKPLDKAVLTQIKQNTLEQLVEKKLVEQKTRELNINISDEELKLAVEELKKQHQIPTDEALNVALAAQGMTIAQFRDKIREDLEKNKLIAMEVRSKVQVSESEMRTYYNANQDKYTGEESFHARHIFFRTSEKDSPEDLKNTMNKAMSVLAEAKDGKDFVELAKRYSEDPAARKDGGDLGIFKKGDMLADLEQTILAMKTGDISNLVQTPTGLHIIKLEERIKSQVRPFESLKPEIENILYNQKTEGRFNQWAKDLRSRATIDMKDLKDIL